MSEKTKKPLKFTWLIILLCSFVFSYTNIPQAKAAECGNNKVEANEQCDDGNTKADDGCSPICQKEGSLGSSWSKNLEKNLPSFVTPYGATGEDMAASVVRRSINLIKYLIGGVALMFGLIYAMSFIFARGNEESLSKSKKNFLWLLVGFLIIMVAENISNIFNPEIAKSDQLINFQAGRDQLRDIANYLKWIFGSVIMLLITISGIRLVTAGGNQETIDKEKRHLIWSSIGMLIILLASNLVNAIYVIKSPEVIIAAESTIAVTELGGIIRLLLVFLGPITILFTIVAGFMYLTALDNEERASKAKRMIIGGVTGIVIIYSAYALVGTFMTAQLTPPGL